MHKIGLIRHRKGDGLIVHRGRIIRYTTKHTIRYCLFPSDIGSRYLPSNQGLPPSPAPGQRSALCCRALCHSGPSRHPLPPHTPPLRAGVCGRGGGRVSGKGEGGDLYYSRLSYWYVCEEVDGYISGEGEGEDLARGRGRLEEGEEGEVDVRQINMRQGIELLLLRM